MNKAHIIPLFYLAFLFYSYSIIFCQSHNLIFTSEGAARAGQQAKVSCSCFNLCLHVCGCFSGCGMETRQTVACNNWGESRILWSGVWICERWRHDKLPKKSVKSGMSEIPFPRLSGWIWGNPPPPPQICHRINIIFLCKIILQLWVGREFEGDWDSTVNVAMTKGRKLSWKYLEIIFLFFLQQNGDLPKNHIH